MPRAKPENIMRRSPAHRARMRTMDESVTAFLSAPVKTPEDHARECGTVAGRVE